MQKGDFEGVFRVIWLNFALQIAALGLLMTAYLGASQNFHWGYVKLGMFIYLPVLIGFVTLNIILSLLTWALLWRTKLAWLMTIPSSGVLFTLSVSFGKISVLDWDLTQVQLLALCLFTLVFNTLLFRGLKRLLVFS